MADENTPIIKPVDVPLYKAALKHYLAELMAMPTLEVERRLTFDPGAAANISERTARICSERSTESCFEPFPPAFGIFGTSK